MSVGIEGPRTPKAGGWEATHVGSSGHTDVKEGCMEGAGGQATLTPAPGGGGRGGVEVRGQCGSLCPPSCRTSWMVVSRDKGCGDAATALTGIPG